MFIGANTDIKLMDTVANINTSASGESLKEEYYDNLFASLKESLHNNAELTQEQEKNIDTVVMNALNYASETITKRDGKEGVKDNAIEFSEWATKSTYEFLNLDINNQDSLEQMKSVFDTMDKNDDGKLDEKELMAVCLYKDATSSSMPKDGEAIVFDGNINAGKERKGIAANMVSLGDKEGRELFNKIFSIVDAQVSASVEDNEKDNEEVLINGVIEDSSQGNVGDCWLLSGLNALSYSKIGKDIIQNSIINNGNDTYTVNLKGVKQSYTFSKAEIKEAGDSNRYSTGDYDVLLMELAVEKFLCEIREGKIEITSDIPKFLDGEDYARDGRGEYIETPIEGGWTTDMLYILTGQDANNQYNIKHSNYGNYAKKYGIKDGNPYEQGENMGTSLDYAYDSIEANKGNVWATLATKNNTNDKPGCEITDINGNVVNIASETTHVFSIKSVDGNIVTFVNPWDSGTDIQVTKDELESVVTDIYFSVL